jgi:hypothetical protein
MKKRKKLMIIDLPQLKGKEKNFVLKKKIYKKRKRKKNS